MKFICIKEITSPPCVKVGDIKDLNMENIPWFEKNPYFKDHYMRYEKYIQLERDRKIDEICSYKRNLG